MSGRFETSVRSLDFGREIEIGITDTLNPTRHMLVRVPELQVEDLAEMFQALVDQLNAIIKGEGAEIKAPSFDRLVSAFEEEVKGARGEDT